MKNALALAAIGIALIAMVVAWNGSSKPSAAAAPEVDLAPLVARIDALEKRVAEARRDAGTPVIEAPARMEVAPSAESSALGTLGTRVEQLERSVAELKIKNYAPGPKPRQPDAKEALTLEQAAQRARDASATEEQRLEGLRALRNKQLADGSDARLQVLDDMILLAQTSTNASTREDIWRQLHHITDARLKGPLLDSLATDKDEKVRAKAADTLDDFMPDRQVEVGLRIASENDPSADVRKVAARSLTGGKR